MRSTANKCLPGEDLQSLQADLRDLVVALHPEYPILAASTMGLVRILATQFQDSHPNAQSCGIRSLLRFKETLLVHAAMIPEHARQSPGFGALLDLHYWLESQSDTPNPALPATVRF